MISERLQEISRSELFRYMETSVIGKENIKVFASTQKIPLLKCTELAQLIKTPLHPPLKLPYVCDYPYIAVALF